MEAGFEGWTPGSFVVGLHGVLRLHPWAARQRELGTLEIDTYALMAGRGTALGLVQFAGQEPNPLARWYQEEGGEDWTQDGAVRQVAWMQAEAANRDAQRFPVWLVLSCLDDAMRRIGTLEPAGARAVLPLHRELPSRPRHGYEWFEFPGHPPDQELTVSLHADDPFDATALAAELRAMAMTRLEFELTAQPATTLGDVEGRWMLGEELHELHLRFQVPERSPDMAALLIDFAAAAARASGIRRYLLVSVSWPASTAG